eukprot:2312614-Rhodomonas_salina.4
MVWRGRREEVCNPGRVAGGRMQSVEPRLRLEVLGLTHAHAGARRQCWKSTSREWVRATSRTWRWSI